MCLMSLNGLLTDELWTIERLQWRFRLREGANIFLNQFGNFGFWGLELRLMSCVEPFIVSFFCFKVLKQVLSFICLAGLCNTVLLKLQKYFVNFGLCGAERHMKVGAVPQLDQHCLVWQFDLDGPSAWIQQPIIAVKCVKCDFLDLDQ